MISNEILLLGSVILIYGTVLVAYRVFHKTGLYVMTAILTILANIEVLMMVDGFGMEQTLGNVMFAATYLVTDILSENESEKDAAKAVWLGGFSAAVVLLLPSTGCFIRYHRPIGQASIFMQSFPQHRECCLQV